MGRRLLGLAAVLTLLAPTRGAGEAIDIVVIIVHPRRTSQLSLEERGADLSQEEAVLGQRFPRRPLEPALRLGTVLFNMALPPVRLGRQGWCHPSDRPAAGLFFRTSADGGAGSGRGPATASHMQECTGQLAHDGNDDQPFWAISLEYAWIALALLCGPFRRCRFLAERPARPPMLRKSLASSRVQLDAPPPRGGGPLQPPP